MKSQSLGRNVTWRKNLRCQVLKIKQYRKQWDKTRVRYQNTFEFRCFANDVHIRDKTPSYHLPKTVDPQER